MTINFNELKTLLNRFAETLIKSGTINSTFINCAIVNKSNIETANEIFKTVEKSQEIDELVSILNQDENKIIKRAFVFAVLLTNITQEQKQVEFLNLLVEKNDLNEEKQDLSKDNNNVENSALANLTAYLNIAIDTSSPQIIELLVEKKNADIDIENNFSVALDMAEHSLDETIHQIRSEPISPEKQEKALEVLKYLSKKLINNYTHIPFIVDALTKSPYQKVIDIPKQIFRGEIYVNGERIQEFYRLRWLVGKALCVAVEHGYHNEIVKLLLDNEPDTNVYNSNGQTALHIAAETGNLALTELLLQENIYMIDRKNQHGATALHIAIEVGNPALIELLLQKGAGMTITNNSGKTALDIIQERGNPALAEPFSNRGLISMPRDCCRRTDFKSKTPDSTPATDKQNRKDFYKGT